MNAQSTFVDSLKKAVVPQGSKLKVTSSLPVETLASVNSLVMPITDSGEHLYDGEGEGN